MTEKRYTTVELPKPNNWGIWYDGNYLSTYEVCHLLNEYVDAKKEYEDLKEQNKELKHDIKFWKLELKEQWNTTDSLSYELHLAIENGYEISDKFKKWIEDSAERNKEVMEKMRGCLND